MCKTFWAEMIKNAHRLYPIWTTEGSHGHNLCINISETSVGRKNYIEKSYRKLTRLKHSHRHIWYVKKTYFKRHFPRWRPCPPTLCEYENLDLHSGPTRLHIKKKTTSCMSKENWTSPTGRMRWFFSCIHHLCLSVHFEMQFFFMQMLNVSCTIGQAKSWRYTFTIQPTSISTKCLQRSVVLSN